MSKTKTILIFIALMLVLGLVGEQDRKTELLEQGYTLEQVNER